MLTYFTILISGIIISAMLAFLAIKMAFRLGIMDKPGLERKIHKAPTPLLGGVGIFLTFIVLAFIFKDELLAGDLEVHHLLGVLAGSLFLIIGGVLDDKYDLTPGKQFIFPILAVLAVVAGGVGIEKITNPFGGLTYLDQLRIPILNFGNGMHYFMVLADTFTILWLLGMMYTTKLLDGMDGLVTGVTAIGAFIIFLFTMTTKYYQPDIGIAALILTGACLGFLIFNWHPAKIFLGESGSLFLGFILGVLAIISGGKIAIALLVMGIPILDVAWTIIRRLAAGKNPLKFADRKHLHFRLFDLGLGTRKTVLIFYLFSIVFGLSALFLQSRGKLLTLGLLIVIMLGMVVGIEKKIKTKS